MLVIGKIIGFHGLKGEVKLACSDRLCKNLELTKTITVQTAKGTLENLDIEYFKVHKTNVLLKFKQYASKTDVEHLRGAVLKQNKEKLAALESDEFFIFDLVGLDVFDSQGVLVGVVNSILTECGNHDLIEIKTTDNKLRLIPFTYEFVPTVDIPDSKVIINVIPGLLDDEV